MTGKVVKKTGDFARVALWCGSSLLASGCVTPSLNVVPSLPTAPTIPQLERHLTCSFVRAMDQHLSLQRSPNADPKTAKDKATAADYVFWHRLVDYNFLGTINLTLFVTQTQGLNPSLNFITPLTNLGHSIQSIEDSSNGITMPTSPTANTSNLTLAVGFQLTGLQDHNFIQTYIVDMHQLYSAMYELDKNGDPIAAKPNGLLAECKGDDGDKSHGVHFGLKGDLEVEDTLKSGLEGLQAMPYTPATVGSAPASKASQQSSSAAISQAAGAASFSEKIDFSLLWGVNGGPNWTLLKFKGPGGGSGTGAQLLNYSRQKQDTLISTFSATCKTDQDVNLGDPAEYSESTPQTTPNNPKDFDAYQFEVYRLVPPMRGETPVRVTSAYLDALPPDLRDSQANEKYIITIAIPVDKTKLPITYTSTAIGTLTVEALEPTSLVKNAIVSWSAFSSAPNQYSLRGILSDAQSGTSLGYIYGTLIPVSGEQETCDEHGNCVPPHTKLIGLRISKNALDAIHSEVTGGPVDYWASLPSCSIAAPFFPGGLNILQQLPGGVSSVLQQQR
jgi:hypothetical protein